MDPAPKALPLYILLTTALVVIGTAAAVLLWMVARPDAARNVHALLPADTEADPRPVDFEDRVPAAERSRLRALGGRLVDPAEAARREEVVAALVAAGEDALPVLLTALHEVASDEKRLAAPDGQTALLALDAALSRIRVVVTPRDPAAALAAPLDLAKLRRRARLWFGWFSRVQAAHAR